MYTCIIYMIYTGWAQIECNTYDQQFQENEGQNEKVVCIIVYKILSPAR